MTLVEVGKAKKMDMELKMDHVDIAEMYLLELQSGNFAREASDEAAHLPRPQRISGCFDCTTFGLAIVLFEAADGVRRATYV